MHNAPFKKNIALFRLHTSTYSEAIDFIEEDNFAETLQKCFVVSENFILITSSNRVREKESFLYYYLTVSNWILQILSKNSLSVK